MPIEKRRVAVTIVFIVIAILVEWFYVNYMLDRGLEHTASGSTVIQGGLPVAILPAIGAFFVLIASWHYASGRILPTRGRPEERGRDTLAWARTVRVALLILAGFISVLFLPYALWSGWFWSFLGGIVGSKAMAGLYENTANVWQLNVLWKYAVSQNLSVLFAAFVAVVYARRPPRVKKIK